MSFATDTITAIATPIGIGGLSVIRVSGDDAIKIVSSVFHSNRKLENLNPNTAIFGRIMDNDRILDEVVLTLFRSPRSYTGEDVIEISCHGNTFITNKILELLLTKCRLAEPGEFTQRAFLNDKMGLTQAEAVGDLLTAKTKFAHQAALQNLEGKLRIKIQKMLDRLTDIRTILEVEIDFSEHDVPTINVKQLNIDLQDLLRDLNYLAKTGEEGLILKDGLKVSLVGAPNVGKSSIFNAFLETERAIVTPIPGTTRDYLEEAISLGGYLVRIFDTAGIRETEDHVEKIGIARSRDVIMGSHKILYIIDGIENSLEYEQLTTVIDEARIIKVLNKSDSISAATIKEYEKKGYTTCSTVSKGGLEAVKATLLAGLEISEEDLNSGILSNSRQIAAVKRSIVSMEKAVESLNGGIGFEFTAFDTKEASNALEEVIGKVTSEDILHRIFDNFCIGK